MMRSRRTSNRDIIACMEYLMSLLPYLVLFVAFTITLLARTAAGQAAASPSNDLQMPGYRPNGMSMWDAWHIEHEGKAYMFHLQRLSSKSKRLPADEDTLGQAVYEDSINWVELPLGLPPGPSAASF